MKLVLRKKLLQIKNSEKTREISRSVVRSSLWGAAAGPVFSLFFSWLSAQPVVELYAHPAQWLVKTCFIGAVFSLLFYLCCGMPWVWLRTRARRMGHAGWLFGIPVCATGGALAAVISIWIVDHVLGVQLVSADSLYRVLVLDAILAVIIGTLIGTFKGMRYRHELREKSLAEAAAKAQAYALQAQIAPHFFFNALNSISALIPVAPEAAQNMISRLADIYRYSFATGRRPTVSLERELEFVREYLLLEKIRYRERLEFSLPEVARIPVLQLPGLTLQPIVENAIRHGIAKRMDGGKVRVEIESDLGECRISVWNQYEPAEGLPDLVESHVFREDHALNNVRNRLKLVCGDLATLRVEQQAGDWVKATVTLPNRPEENHDARGDR